MEADIRGTGERRLMLPSAPVCPRLGSQSWTRAWRYSAAWRGNRASAGFGQQVQPAGQGRPAGANGVTMGRKPKLTPHQKREAIRRRDKGEDSLAEIGRSYNVSGWTISRLQT
jgi:hypothetical protein